MSASPPARPPLNNRQVLEKPSQKKTKKIFPVKEKVLQGKYFVPALYLQSTSQNSTVFLFPEINGLYIINHYITPL